MLSLTEEELALSLPMVEVFQTVEGEGLRAGFPTTFVRIFNCNLRCTWCDTLYSYAPAKPEYFATVQEIAQQVASFGNHYVCLTGGEPLLYTEKVLVLLRALAEIDAVHDIHVETNGAIDLTPFAALRKESDLIGDKVRFILDYKLPKSGESDKMIHSNYRLLEREDEIKFVIADEEDFKEAVRVMNKLHQQGTVLFSPVWETMPPARLVELILDHKLVDVKLNLQIHKVIWDPAARGV